MLLESPNIDHPFYCNPLTNDQQKFLAHSHAAGHKAFHYQMIKILKNLLELDDDSFNKLTIIDYFVILLQVRTFFIDNEIASNITCDCENTINVKFMISNRIEEIDQVFNKDFSKIVKSQNLKLGFNVPLISDITTFVDLHPSEWITLFLTSIDSVKLQAMNYEQRKTIFNSLPINASREFEEEFMKILELEISDYINIRCPKCKYELSKPLKFSIMLDLIADYFFRFNYDACLMELALIARKLNISPQYMANVSPMEKQKYLDIIEEQKKQESSPDGAGELLTNSSEFGF